MTLRYPLVLNGQSIEELQNGDSLAGLSSQTVGLDNVDNTADIDKPVSTAQQAALDLKANINADTTGTATKAINLKGGNTTTLYGAMYYQSAVDTSSILPPNTTTTKKFLRQTGNGSNGAAPAWDTIAIGDLPTITPEKGGTGVANGSNNTLTFTGNYTLGITLTGNTAITLPTSGTLINSTDTAAKATVLATTRAIYGNNFDGSAALTQIIGSAYGGTGNGFAKFTGPTTSEKTFALPNSSETLLYSGGGLGTPGSGVLTNCTGLPQSGLAANVVGNGPAFRCTQSGQSVTSAWVKLTGWTEQFDLGSYFDSVTNSRFQPGVAGYYLINGHMQMSGTSGAASVSVYKNGSSYAAGVYIPVSSTNPGSIVTTLVYLNGSSDYIELYGYSLTTLNTAGSAFSGCLVRCG